jgi:hypothetical protein
MSLETPETADVNVEGLSPEAGPEIQASANTPKEPPRKRYAPPSAPRVMRFMQTSPKP